MEDLSVKSCFSMKKILLFFLLFLLENWRNIPKWKIINNWCTKNIQCLYINGMFGTSITWCLSNWELLQPTENVLQSEALCPLNHLTATSLCCSTLKAYLLLPFFLSLARGVINLFFLLVSNLDESVFPSNAFRLSLLVNLRWNNLITLSIHLKLTVQRTVLKKIKNISETHESKHGIVWGIYYGTKNTECYSNFEF